MEITKSSRRQLRIQTLVFGILFFAVIGLLAALSVIYKFEVDWTATGRHTLSDASRKVLDRLSDPVSITAYVSGGDNSAGRERVKEVLKRYQKHKPDIELRFVDPLANPDKVREQGVRVEGELIVSYKNRNEHVTSVDETSLTNTLQRLLRSGERHIVFVSGHGERAPNGRANHDLSLLMQNMASKGLQAKTVNLGQERAIPVDTAVLVIASPQVDYLPGEIKLIDEYISRGGNVLWLHDPFSKVTLSTLTQSLGFKFKKGIIVDLEVGLLGINDPTIVMAAQYPQHAITQNFAYLTLFPGATAIDTSSKSDWQYNPLLNSVTKSWLETEPKEKVSFDRGSDIPGPVTFGVVGMREIKNATSKPASDTTPPRMQRVVILGDGDFISNAYLGNQGNQQLGENIINWLVQDDNFIDIPPTTAPGNKLSMSNTNWALLGGFFLLVLPTVLLALGLFIWLRRRKR